MDTALFLQRVLPPAGVYAAITLDSGKPAKQRFFTDIGSLAAALLAASTDGHNIYFATATFREAGNRRATNVEALQSFYLDIDCGEGKPYASWKEGLLAFGNALKGTTLPKPMIVFSGNGLHVYWPLTRALPREEWQPIANGLKEVFTSDTFKMDTSVPADPARVLRAVGTINPKGGREVKVLIPAEPVDPEQISAALRGYVHPKVSVVQSRGPTIDLSVKTEFPPAKAETIKTKCAQVSWAVENADKVEEPFWYALLGVAAFCEDPDQVAIEWSKGHPTFSESETVRKVHQWRTKADGPTTCARFGELRSKGCAKCPFRDHIGSPARLGVQYAAVEIAATAPDAVARSVPLPKTFKRAACPGGQTGIKQDIDGTDVDICNFDIYPVSYGRDEALGYEVVRYKWDRLHSGWQDLTLRQAHLNPVSGKEFATEIADQGIVFNFKTQLEAFQFMLRSYMEELRKLKAVTNLHSSMGWKEHNTQFLIGDRIIRRTKEGAAEVDEVTLASSIARVNDQMFTKSGTVAEFARFTATFEKLNLDIHKFAMGLAFGAPLLTFSGLKGSLVNLYGPTGSGKSLAQMAAQAVFGDPEKTHFSAKTTQNALFARIGHFNNLLVTIDEVTMMPDKEVGDFCYGITQGRDKARLSRTADEREARTFSTFVLTSSNRSLSSKMTSSGMETDAQMARLLEITMDQHPAFAKETTIGRTMYEYLSKCHGAVGEVYLKHLIELGEQGIRAAIAEQAATFAATYQAEFAGHERFWEQTIWLADLGNKIAKSLDLIQYDYTAGTKAVLNQLGAIRSAVEASKIDAFDLVAEYMNDVADSSLTVMHTDGMRDPLYGDPSRLPRNGIRCRVDVYRKALSAPFTHGTVMLDRAHFKKWLSLRHGDYKAVVAEFDAARVNATPKSGKLWMAKDTPLKLAQLYVLGLNLNHPRLQGILNDADQQLEDLTLGQLKVM